MAMLIPAVASALYAGVVGKTLYTRYQETGFDEDMTNLFDKLDSRTKSREQFSVSYRDILETRNQDIRQIAEAHKMDSSTLLAKLKLKQLNKDIVKKMEVVTICLFLEYMNLNEIESEGLKNKIEKKDTKISNLKEEIDRLRMGNFNLPSTANSTMAITEGETDNEDYYRKKIKKLKLKLAECRETLQVAEWDRDRYRDRKDKFKQESHEYIEKYYQLLEETQAERQTYDEKRQKIEKKYQTAKDKKADYEHLYTKISKKHEAKKNKYAELETQYKKLQKKTIKNSNFEEEEKIPKNHNTHTKFPSRNSNTPPKKLKKSKNPTSISQSTYIPKKKALKELGQTRLCSSSSSSSSPSSSSSGYKP